MSRFGKIVGKNVYVVDIGDDAVDFTSKKTALATAGKLVKEGHRRVAVIYHPVVGPSKIIFFKETQSIARRR